MTAKAVPNLAAIFAVLLWLLPGSQAFATLTDQAETPEQKRWHRAIKQINAGDWTASARTVRSLRDYPLYHYLLAKRIRKFPDRYSNGYIQTLLDKVDGQPVADQIRNDRLWYLAGKKHWKAYLTFYRDQGRDVRQRCHRVRALRAAGRVDEADGAAADIWKTGHSLPKSCDPVVYGWLKRQPDQSARRWQRARMALAEGNGRLAAFVLKPVKLDNSLRRLLKRPREFERHADQLPDHPYAADIGEYALMALARRDYAAASRLWLRYREPLQLSNTTNSRIRQRIARQMIAAGDESAADWLQRHHPNGDDEFLLEWQLRLAISAGDWEGLIAYVQQLPESLKSSHQWQYWHARARLQLDPEDEFAQALLTEAARYRGYYSFLAADLLGQPYELGSVSVRPLKLDEVAARPGLIRARELLAVGWTLSAAREWNRATADFDYQELESAALLAHRWGWHRRAITTALRAGQFDDLSLRFPTPWQGDFVRHAQRQNIPAEWLYAVARQESAFDQRARSSAGAMGLLQLMPGTARMVSKQEGLRYSRSKLYRPEHSIRLGASYLSELIGEFEGNRILATAAYNAGPARIQKVLGRQTGEVPVDVWIETLPYSETRHYVKNVLAFSVIYSRHLNSVETVMLYDNERIITVPDTAGKVSAVTSTVTAPPS